MVPVVIVAGLVIHGIGWWLVASGRRDVWRLMPFVLGSMGVGALLVGSIEWATEVSLATAAGAGLVVGALLYVSTRVFVAIAVRWAVFRRDVEREYSQTSTVSASAELLLSLAIMVPSEELFYRGLVQGEAATVMSLAAAAGTAWICYIAANAPSRSLSIVFGAIVAGGLWGVLAWWSGGVLAGLASHILWTGAMLVAPPGAGRRAETT